MKKFLKETDEETRDCKIYYSHKAGGDKTMIEVKGQGKEIINGLIALIGNISLDVANEDKKDALEVVDFFCDIAKEYIRGGAK